MRTGSADRSVVAERWGRRAPAGASSRPEAERWRRPAARAARRLDLTMARFGNAARWHKRGGKAVVLWCRGAVWSAVVISSGSVVVASAARLRHVVGPCVWVLAVSVSFAIQAR
jgi:hypothetical protein